MHDMTSYYFIIMVLNGKHKFVFTPSDIEFGGFEDAKVEDFGCATKEEAETQKKELEEYADKRGYTNLRFYIHEINISK